jgi:hypothetical protein
LFYSPVYSSKKATLNAKGTVTKAWNKLHFFSKKITHCTEVVVANEQVVAVGCGNLNPYTFRAEF